MPPQADLQQPGDKELKGVVGFGQEHGWVRFEVYTAPPSRLHGIRRNRGAGDGSVDGRLPGLARIIVVLSHNLKGEKAICPFYSGDTFRSFGLPEHVLDVPDLCFFIAVPLSHMAVKEAAQEVQDRDGELAEDLLVDGFDDVGRLDEGVLPQVVPVISDDPFLHAPPGLEPPEPIVVRFRPAQTEGPITVIAGPSDRLPHDQVACPEMLKCPVRGSVFVKDLISEREIDVGGDRGSLKRGQDDKTPIPGKDLIVNGLKETAGLGGEAVGSPCQCIQAAEVPQGIRRCGEGDVKVLFFGLPDASAGAVRKTGRKIGSCCHFRACSLSLCLSEV